MQNTCSPTIHACSCGFCGRGSTCSSGKAHPWTPPFDKTMGVLVGAESEPEARRLAQAKAGNEGQQWN
jgi:hypothetical protein